MGDFLPEHLVVLVGRGREVEQKNFFFNPELSVETERELGYNFFQPGKILII